MSVQRANQLVEAGLWLRLSGDHEGSRRLFEQALRLDPGNLRARQLLEARPPGAAPPAPRPPPPSDPFVPPASEPGTVSKEWALALEMSAGAAEEPPAPASAPIAQPIPPLARAAPPPSPPRQAPAAEPPSPPADEPIDLDDHVAPVDLGALEDPFAGAPPASAPEELVLGDPLEDVPSGWESKSGPGVRIAHSEDLGAAMDLVEADQAPPSRPGKERSGARDEVRALVDGAKDLIELDDHSGAMELIQKAIALAPDDPEVCRLKEKSERTLQAMFESKLGRLDAIPRVALKEDEIIWLNLDHRAGFVLAQIDGTVTFEDLFAVSGMSRLDTARILAQLVEQGVISM